MQRDVLLLTEMIDAAEQARELTRDISPAGLEEDRRRHDALPIDVVGGYFGAALAAVLACFL
jgi:hypothetical protein